MMKRFVVAATSILFVLLISLTVLAFTKSQEFIDANKPKNSTVERVGIAAGQLAPKEPRFKKFIPPRIIPSISVITVGFADLIANEPRPIVTPVSEIKKAKPQLEQKKANKALPEERMRNALLTVKSARVPDQRVSAQAGSIVSLAIILVGLLIYGSMRLMMRKSAA